MAKIVQTTDEAVLEAAEDFPEAKGILRDLFPDAFPVVFKPGDIVNYKEGHIAGPFVVADRDLSEMVRAKYLSISSTDVVIISLRTGTIYSPPPTYLKIVKEKF